MLDKDLNKFTDEELLQFINDRREYNIIPKIRKQIRIVGKMAELAKELDEHIFRRDPSYGSDYNKLAIIQLQNQVNHFMDELERAKSNILVDITQEDVEEAEDGQEQA